MSRYSVIKLEPRVLRWARERAGLNPADLADKISVKPERVEEWEISGQITMAQARKLAKRTYTPLGCLYLPEPMDDSLPIPDLRTVGDKPLHSPSPSLLDTILMMQSRQIWMRDEMINEGEDPLDFTAGVSTEEQPEKIASAMRKTLNLSSSWARDMPAQEDALRQLRDCIDDMGILVVINGIVGNNTRRKLDTKEFRGFALADRYVPLIFINGADAKVAQMFTLIHELAHVWIGASGVSDYDDEALEPIPGKTEQEQFCNRVAAEFLVPQSDLKEAWDKGLKNEENCRELRKRFKVSGIVVARRAFETELISDKELYGLRDAWQQESKSERQQQGGNFWYLQNGRIGKRFGIAVVRAVKEGRLLYRDAYWLTNLKGEVFDTFARRIEADL